MHHAVAHGVDLALVPDDAGRCVGQVADDQLDAVLVIGDVAGDDVLLLALVVVQHRALDADALQQALGQHDVRFHVDELKFDRGTAAIDDQNFHCTLSAAEFLILIITRFPGKAIEKLKH